MGEETERVMEIKVGNEGRSKDGIASRSLKMNKLCFTTSGSSHLISAQCEVHHVRLHASRAASASRLIYFLVISK